MFPVLRKCIIIGMKLIMDYIPNHSSNQHPWFLESRLGGEDNKYADYYCWHSGKVLENGTRVPPNNWVCGNFFKTNICMDI